MMRYKDFVLIPVIIGAVVFLHSIQSYYVSERTTYSKIKPFMVSKKSKTYNDSKAAYPKLKHNDGYRDISLLKDCPNTTFPEKLEDNIEKVNSYNFTVPEGYLEKLQLDDKGVASLISINVSSSMPVLVSGFSANHFGEFEQNWNITQRSLLKAFPTMKVILYNLGFSEKLQDQVKNMCNGCEIRKFKFGDFPKHVRNLKSYTWKPILLQGILQEYDFVLWTDTSVLVNANNASKLFSNAIKHGIQSMNGDGTIAGRTSGHLFKLLNEDPCSFRVPEIAGGWVTIKRTEFTLKYIMRPWVSCAIQFGCMEFPNSRNYLPCPGRLKKVGSCHRFDQSTLGIILTRLFNKNRDRVTFKGNYFGALHKI